MNQKSAKVRTIKFVYHSMTSCSLSSEKLFHTISLYFLFKLSADDLGKQERKDADNEHENNENKSPKAKLEEKPAIIICSENGLKEKDMPLQEECKVSATLFFLLIYTILHNS